MQGPTTLCPGYKHVEAFGPVEDYESEGEVSYVTLDLGDVEPQLVPSSTSYRLIGLDSPSPYLQLQGTIMKGRHDLLLGTEMIFMDERESHEWDKRSVIHVANTEQRIAFQEVTLIPKTPSSKAQGKQKATTSDGIDDDDDEALAINITTDNFQSSQKNEENRRRAQAIDRLTGLAAPTTRRTPRKTKEKSTSKKTPKKGKKKETIEPSTNAKGKEKETLPPQECFDADAIGEDDMDDMYVDAE